MREEQDITTDLGIGEGQTGDGEKTFPDTHDEILRYLPEYVDAVRSDILVLDEYHLHRWATGETLGISPVQVGYR